MRWHELLTQVRVFWAVKLAYLARTNNETNTIASFDW